jgi:hypothetical protein
MGGGLMQLVAYGAQDIYLTGNPQITFFKVVYRRHTNFSMEAIEQTVSGSTSAGGRNTATISRNGDLLGRMYWEYGLQGEGNALNPGHLILDEVKVEIGGQEVDKQYGHWMEVHSQLTEPNSAGMLCEDIEDNTGTKFQNMAKAGGVSNGAGEDASNIYVPLRFWFCRNPGCYLPLIALQYHEVKVVTTFNGSATGTLTLVAGSAKLWADYVYLDTDERRRFAQVSHEYLIEQVQHQSNTGATQDINFNHPVKELIWTGAYNTGTGVFTDMTSTTFKIKLNGHDRMEARPTSYFTQVQVYEHHTGTPVNLGTNPVDAGGVGNAHTTGIAVYSFALKPEEHQPSGTCNFSRIDNAQLVGSADDVRNVYAVNYNVLRVMSGMGGLAYSN